MKLIDRDFALKECESMELRTIEGIKKNWFLFFKNQCFLAGGNHRYFVFNKNCDDRDYIVMRFDIYKGLILREPMGLRRRRQVNYIFNIFNAIRECGIEDFQPILQDLCKKHPRDYTLEIIRRFIRKYRKEETVELNFSRPIRRKFFVKAE